MYDLMNGKSAISIFTRSAAAMEFLPEIGGFEVIITGKERRAMKMSKILFFGLLCCLLMTASVSSGDKNSPGTVTVIPGESDTVEDPDSVQNISFANFKDTLNDVEMKMAVRHPVQAFQVYLAASKAEETTTRLYGSNGFQDNADAFRHCLWNALMKKSIGEDAAREWANAHEAYSEGADRDMDLYNNEVGRGIAVEALTEDQIISCVQSLVSTGKCLRIVDGHCESTG